MRTMVTIGKHPEVGADPLRHAWDDIKLVLGLADRVRQYFTARAAEFDLSPPQAKVLLQLQPGEALPMRTLADQLRYDPSNLTGLIDKLAAQGAVERQPDATDRRVKALALTAAGMQLRHDFQERLLGAAQPLGALSESQMQELRRLLQLALGQG
jgi:DNA-binding MarR family transcriptional regulator